MAGESGGLAAILKNRRIQIECGLPPDKTFFKAATVVEGFSKITEISIDFLSQDKALVLSNLVGKSITLKQQLGEDEGGSWRKFVGTCIEAQYVGLYSGYACYAMQVRSWPWFLTRTTNNRIFQRKNAVDIIKEVFAGFAGLVQWSTSATYQVREYTVQYNETDYDFICRLMEEEGMYFYSKENGGKDELVIADGIGGHAAVPGAATIEFADSEQQGYRRANDHIFEFGSAEAVTSGKVSLMDYDFTATATNDLTVAKPEPKGTHSYKDFELYAYPGRYRKADLGNTRGTIRIQAEACKHATRTAAGNVRTLATGAFFTLNSPSRSADNGDYLITSATHSLQIETDEKQEKKNETEIPGRVRIDEKNKDAYRCNFTTIPKTVQYRAPLKTSWPKIPGILIAKVTGPSGEEIYTDEYGRIRVQFPWDRAVVWKGDGKGKEASSCWVRVVSAWVGQAYGLYAIPRIGQEVVIQFEDGDPDRPICTGMLYNAVNKPPYALPANMTQTGIVTRSSKGGSAETFNELIFEDKKDAEFVRLQSEKDYFEKIKNNATITVGMEKQDPGDLTITVYNNRNEFVKQGDSTFKVETGNEIRDIKTDHTETIGQHATKLVKGNKTSTVKGNMEGTVDGNTKLTTKGDMESAVTGKSDNTVTGNYTHTVTGSITIESKQKIELKVGANSITIDNTGVTISGTMIKTSATTMAEHTGSAMMTIKGGVVMIN
jgi:type VI secretion system secreted protein VgrG